MRGALTAVLALRLAAPAWAEDGGSITPDAGADASTRAPTMMEEYGCVDAPAPVEVPDGGTLWSGESHWPSPGLKVSPGSAVLAPARIQRVNCALLACQFERDTYRDAGSPSPIQASHVVTAIIGLVGTIVTGYCANRTGRHLPLF